MYTTQAQQKALDDALVVLADHHKIKKCHMRLKTYIKPKEATFQVVLDALALTPFYQAFLITTEFPAIYIFALKFQDKSLKTSHWNKISSLSSEILDTMETSSTLLILKTKMLNRQTRCHILDSQRSSLIPSCQRINTQVYGTILPKELTNQAMLESKAYQTYYAFASVEKASKPKYIQKKADSDISPKKKLVQATKRTRIKTLTKVAKSITPPFLTYSSGS
ncbi:hypothetical protein Tco_1546587 [Tanacetum coccineum]